MTCNLPDCRKRVFFSTGSAQKLEQYRYLLSEHGLAVEPLRPLRSVHEPQVDGSGPQAETVLVELPLKDLARFAVRGDTFPLVVEDTMLFIEHFNEDWARPMLPGPDTKRWWHALGNDGVLRLLDGSGRRRALYVCQLGVLTGRGDYLVFRSEIKGRIANSSRTVSEAWSQFPRSNPTYFHQIFVPSGTDITLAEMMPEQFAAFDYRRIAVNRAATALTQAARHEPQVPLFAA